MSLHFWKSHKIEAKREEQHISAKAEGNAKKKAEPVWLVSSATAGRIRALISESANWNKSFVFNEGLTLTHGDIKGACTVLETPVKGDGVENIEQQSRKVDERKSNRESRKRQDPAWKRSHVEQILRDGGAKISPYTIIECIEYKHRSKTDVVRAVSSVGQEASSSPSEGTGTTSSPSNKHESVVLRLQPEEKNQPFTVAVNPTVMFLCDLHSHLATTEVIGLYGGRWDQQNRCLNILAAFPCRSLQTSSYSGSTDVEMDPASEVQVQELIRRMNMQVVGTHKTICFPLD
jgi:hypothetical protein